MSDINRAAELYLDLLKQILTRKVVPEKYRPLTGAGRPGKRIYQTLFTILHAILARKSLEIVRRYETDWAKREQGRDWPPDAETMIGMKRLENVQACIADVLRDGIPGDLIEAGTWRGGAAIFMRAALSAFGDTTRTVWVADSFEGLPKPDPEKYPCDAGDDLWQREYLAVSLETVQANFERYGLLDDRVRFLKGWFKDTLPTAPIAKLAVARLDGDMYESTIQALGSLYPKLSIGGYLIVDDYGDLPGCKAAVDDYRAANGIGEEIQRVDWTGICWRRLQ